MNIFQLLADLSHLLAIIILFLTIWQSKSCNGVSGRTTILYAVVFITRYVDIFDRIESIYNSVFKTFYLVFTFLTLYLIYFAYYYTYNRHDDTFSISFLISICIAMAILINNIFTFQEVLWTFSLYLEAVAVQPQIHLVTVRHEAETITKLYLIALGLYRLFCICDWIYLYIYEAFYNHIVIAAGCLQTIMYYKFVYAILCTK
ncbi:hypothetical protein GJ496_008038, partial [Pomphorhynchus laevis]